MFESPSDGFKKYPFFVSTHLVNEIEMKRKVLFGTILFIY